MPPNSQKFVYENRPHYGGRDEWFFLEHGFFGVFLIYNSPCSLARWAEPHCATLIRMFTRTPLMRPPPIILMRTE